MHAKPTETQNQDPRPPPNLFRCYKSNDSPIFRKQVSVKNHVFRGKPNYLDLHEISITYYPGLYFGNRAYPWTHVDEYGLILGLNHYFDWQVKIWYFGRFWPLGLEIWDWSSRAIVNARRVLLSSNKRYEFKFLTFYDSVINWYLFDFMKKHKIWKSNFYNKNDFYKTNVANLILKCFLNNWKFYKNKFETWFFLSARFTIRCDLYNDF